MALIIAGDRSGVGKTTITLAILAYLTQQGDLVQSFKVGPDYIDPMFHSQVTGLPCRNLDPVLTSPSYVKQCFQLHSQNAESAVVEGVMGLFDGISNPDNGDRHSLNDYGSTAHIARILNLPVALVLDCSRLSSSIAAIATGYANLDPQINIAGVILNQVASNRHLELLTTALTSISMPILGVVKRDRQIALGDRHLGLIPAPEVTGLKQLSQQLAHIAKASLDWDKLLPLIQNSLLNSQLPQFLTPPTPDAKQYPLGQLSHSQTPIRIAIALDRAFNFYYQDNLDLLAQLGAELIYWSPLEDIAIPENIQGLYFGGGFPEMFASQLAANKNVLERLRQTIKAGIPTYAECGGLMYLCQELIDLNKQSWSMVGLIPSSVTMQAKLTLGYRQAIALQDSCLVKTQQTVKGHEFHHSQLTVASATPQWQLQGFHKSSPLLQDGWNIGRLHASYLHLHWGEYRYLAEQFVRCCRNWEI